MAMLKMAIPSIRIGSYLIDRFVACIAAFVFTTWTPNTIALNAEDVYGSLFVRQCFYANNKRVEGSTYFLL